MTEEKPKAPKSLASPPVLDKSKWVHIEKPEPVDPHLVIEVARAIRANPEIWAIFTSVSPEQWLSDEDGARIDQFTRHYFENSGRAHVPHVFGLEKSLLRSHLAGNPENMEDTDELLIWLKSRPGAWVLGGRLK